MMGVRMMVVRGRVWESCISGMEAVRKRISSVAGPCGCGLWLWLVKLLVVR